MPAWRFLASHGRPHSEGTEGTEDTAETSDTPALWRWSLALDSPIAVAPNNYGSCLSPNGRLGLVSAPDGHVTVWDLDSAKEVGALQTREAVGGGTPTPAENNGVVHIAP